MQFNLRSVLVGMVIISVYLGLAFAVPMLIAGPMMLLITALIPVAVVCGIVYCRGPDRAFWIGCAAGGAAPWGACLLVVKKTLGEFPDINIIDTGQTNLLVFAGAHSLIFISGLFGLALRQSILRRQAVAENMEE